MSIPLITAHTGCMNTEANTLESVVEGIRHGADVVEVDVRATRDGISVLAHDVHVPVGDRLLPIMDMDYVNSGLTRLDEVLELVKRHNKIANLDLKTIDAADSMIECVQSLDMLDRVIVTGCHQREASELKRRYSKVQVLLNTDVEWFDGRDYNEAVNHACRIAVDTGCCGININYKYVRSQLIDRASQLYLPVSVWTVDDIFVMKSLVDMGAHSITTNKVYELSLLLNNSSTS
ncbi:glycerophosphodiester phosphodiesterase [Paenibacillus chungangensis]|uniref:Glycerophosphodiester phosphodiesterase n=1 Tax=Paenibacillus chungangensis TaxID=696535 RepID=A0ABW3HLA1_9BACL